MVLNEGYLKIWNLVKTLVAMATIYNIIGTIFKGLLKKHWPEFTNTRPVLINFHRRGLWMVLIEGYLKIWNLVKTLVAMATRYNIIGTIFKDLLKNHWPEFTESNVSN